MGCANMPDGAMAVPPQPPAFAGLRARYISLLASPRFQRWAMRFPLTRPIARRRARALFDLTAGFVYSQILAACVQLDLFETLRPGPRSLAELSTMLDLPPAAAERLLRAAAALKLTAVNGRGEYGLGSLGAALLGNPGVTGLIGHHALLYQDLADPVGLLRHPRRAGALAGYWPYAAPATDMGVGAAGGRESLSSEQVGAYSALMAASNGMIADQLLHAYDITRHRRVLDIGGGEGAFVREAARRAPDIQFTVFDLPPVAHRAERHFAAAGISDRARGVGGDFFRDSLPAGADLITLLRVIHDHDDEAAAALLRRARHALAPGGTLLLAEPMAETAGAEPIGDAYFGFYLLAMGSGRPRSREKLCAMLQEAGFAETRVLRTPAPMLAGVITARAKNV
jgi:demethylspheroidene O-methyltransferase